jgi:hypothetical protein
MYTVENFAAENSGSLAKAWNRDIVKIPHSLNTNELFSRESLIELIRENPDCVFERATMNKDAEDKSSWKEAALASDDPSDLFNAIDSGAVWTNLGNVGARDARYQKLLDDIMESLEGAMPEFSSFNRQIGIIVSSPNARVFYHADVPGQGLLQIQGEKTIWLYPGTEPYLKQAELERVVVGSTTEEITYDASYEDVATKVEFKPGQGLFWPLNWPHRVVNGPMVNVSATVEYSTRETRRHYAVNYTNGVMSNLFGYKPRSREVTGANYWTKAAVSYCLRHTGLGEKLVSNGK